MFSCTLRRPLRHDADTSLVVRVGEFSRTLLRTELLLCAVLSGDLSTWAGCVLTVSLPLGVCYDKRFVHPSPHLCAAMPHLYSVARVGGGICSNMIKSKQRVQCGFRP